MISGETKAISISEARAAYGRTSEHIILYTQDMLDNTGTVLENEDYKPFPVIFSEFESWYKLERYSLTISIEDLLVTEEDWGRFTKSLSLGEHRSPISKNQAKGLNQKTEAQKRMIAIGMGFIPEIIKENPLINTKLELANKIREKLESMETELESKGLKIVSHETIQRHWLKEHTF